MFQKEKLSEKKQILCIMMVLMEIPMVSGSSSICLFGFVARRDDAILQRRIVLISWVVKERNTNWELAYCIPPTKEQNHLQNCFWRGYVSSGEGIVS